MLPLVGESTRRLFMASHEYFFHDGCVIAPARGAIAADSMEKCLLSCFYIAFLAMPNFQSRLLDGA